MSVASLLALTIIVLSHPLLLKEYERALRAHAGAPDDSQPVLQLHKKDDGSWVRPTGLQHQYYQPPQWQHHHYQHLYQQQQQQQQRLGAGALHDSSLAWQRGSTHAADDAQGKSRPEAAAAGAVGEGTLPPSLAALKCAWLEADRALRQQGGSRAGAVATAAPPPPAPEAVAQPQQPAQTAWAPQLPAVMSQPSAAAVAAPLHPSPTVDAALAGSQPLMEVGWRAGRPEPLSPSQASGSARLPMDLQPRLHATPLPRNPPTIGPASPGAAALHTRLGELMDFCDLAYKRFSPTKQQALSADADAD